MGKTLGTTDLEGTNSELYATTLQAGLLEAWAREAGDPDHEHVARWLREGAPAGVELQIEDPGIFPTLDDPKEGN